MKVLNNKFIIILAWLLVLYSISCSHTQKAGVNDIPIAEFMSFSDFPEEGLLLLRISGYLDNAIKESDFCVIGERVITKHELVPGPGLRGEWGNMPEALKQHFLEREGWDGYFGYSDPREYSIEGEIKVRSIIYGNPGTQEILFHYNDSGWYKSQGYWEVTDIIPINAMVPVSVSPGKSPFTVIAFGKGKSKDQLIIGGTWQNKATISIQAIKAIKDLTLLPSDEFQKQQDELLVKSNNQELLSYLFRRNRCDKDKIISVINTVADKGIKTPKRKWLAYGWSLYLLYESFSAFHEDKWNNSDRQLLMGIATKQFTGITSASEGIKYLRLLGMFIHPLAYRKENKIHFSFGGRAGKDDWKKYCESPEPVKSKLLEKYPSLRSELKKITADLSRKFKDDKDYPEWEKWVKKIFSDEIPKNEK